MSQGRGRTLEAWIRMLPDALIDRNPWLTVLARRLPYAVQPRRELYVF